MFVITLGIGSIIVLAIFLAMILLALIFGLIGLIILFMIYIGWWLIPLILLFKRWKKRDEEQ